MLYKKKRLYIIVGEESGENIAFSILKSLNNYCDLKLFGIGGERLKSLGLESLFPFSELSIMGIVEVLPKIPKILSLINKTAKNIQQINPDLIITVDSPDFSLRVIKKIKKINPNFKTLHIVAPSVWAWKSGRAKKMSSYVDNLFVLFPFEKKYFQPHGIKTTFIGHPLLEGIKLNINNKSYKTSNKKKIISIFPGSRKAEINRHLKLILLFLSKNNYANNYQILIVAVDRYFKLVTAYKSEFPDLIDISILKASKYKNYALKNSYCAIAVSGTISLELAISKVPLIVVYRLSPFTFFLLKKVVKQRFISLANIVLNKKVIPELIQNNLTLENLQIELSALINNCEKRDKQIKMFEKLRAKLQKNLLDSKTIAANEILKILS